MKKIAMKSVFVLGIFLCMLDTTIMNVSLPSIGSQFHVGLDSMSWALNVYLILFAALTIPLTRLAELFGIYRGFLIGVVLFGTGSVFSAYSDTLTSLLIGRAIQSIGAAVVFPLSMTLGIRLVPDNKRTQMIGLLGITQGLAAALGPAIGGIVTQYCGWQWIFLINMPVVIIIILFGLMYLPVQHDERCYQKLDVPGALLSMVFLTSLSVWLMQGRVWGWMNWETCLCASVAVISFVLFLIVEKYSSNPMVPLILFKDQSFALASIIIIVSNVFLVATTVILPNYFTNVAGMNILHASFLIAPISFSIFIFAPISGFARAHVSSKWLIVGGFSFIALGYLWLGTGGLLVIWKTIIAGILIGSGYGIVTGPILVIAAGNLHGQLLTASQSVTGVLRQVGIMLAVAVFVTGLYSGLTQANYNAFDYAKKEIATLKLPKDEQTKVISTIRIKMSSETFSTSKQNIAKSQLVNSISKIENHTFILLRGAFERLYLYAIPFIGLSAGIGLFLKDKRKVYNN